MNVRKGDTVIVLAHHLWLGKAAEQGDHAPDDQKGDP